jgi:RNA polymerase sigma factor (sigma-70 family)
MTTHPRENELADFYHQHAARVRRLVAVNVRGSADLAHDACQEAWAILLRRDDITLDDRGASWLTTVAIREGWRLTTRDADHLSGALDREAHPHATRIDAAADDPPLEERAIARDIHRRRVAALRTLAPRERLDLYLHGLGYRYQEIARLTGSTYTAINRRLAEGRAKLRHLDGEYAAQDAS